MYNQKLKKLIILKKESSIMYVMNNFSFIPQEYDEPILKHLVDVKAVTVGDPMVRVKI